MAPRIIHMIYFPWGKDQKLRADLDDFDHRPYEHMRRYAPDFEVTLWTYNRARDFCVAHYPDVWEAIHKASRPMMMVDALRWLVVHHFGGIYWQYDMNALVAMDRMLPSPGKAVRVFTEFELSPEACMKAAAEPIRRGEPEEPVRVVNQAFAAEPRHAFIKSTMDLIVQRIQALECRKDYDLLYISANAAVSTAYDRFGKNDPTVERLPRSDTRNMMKIQYKGTWRSDAGRRSQQHAAAPRPSLHARSAKGVKRVIKSMPLLAGGFYRWVEPHPHETAWHQMSRDQRRDRVAHDVLRTCVDTCGVRSVLEFPRYGDSVLDPETQSRITYAAGTLSRDDGTASFLNPMYSRLPGADLYILRDYFEYLPYADIQQVIGRLRQAGVRYLLATHHPYLNSHWDTALGDWRPLNLALEPFSLNEPEMVVREPDRDRRPDRSWALFRL